MKKWFLAIVILFPASGGAQCLPAAQPVIAAPAIVPLTHSYTIAWDGNLSLTPSFELQESTSESFADPVTMTVSGALTRTISAHAEANEERRFYYRVRGIAACSGGAGEYSRTASTVVTPPSPQDATEFSFAIPAGTIQPVVQNYLVPGFGESALTQDVFNLTLDASWITVFPPTGALSAGGTTVQFTIDPTKMSVGTSRTTLSVIRTQPSRSVTFSVPISVSVAPVVMPLPRQTPPPPTTRIIPGIAHADGSNSRFQSDVRLLNIGTQTASYELAFTPTASDGRLTGKKILVDIAANELKSFDDIVKMFFGAGVAGESGIGTLEIRPSSSGAPIVASSRTYNVNSSGTFGQYIPALPFGLFIRNIAADPLARISLQQIAASPAFRTNLGFVEGSGEDAELIVRLFDRAGRVIGQVPFFLRPFEHRQLNMNDPALFPGVTINEGRVEVEVTSPTGLVTAYASVLDNQTSDPLLVSPVLPGYHLTSRTVLPGVAELTTARNFHTDMQIFNGGTAPVTVPMNYRPQTGESTAVPPQVMAVLDAKEVLPINNALPALWGLTATGGAVTLTTSSEIPLVVSARTFSRNATNGTFGQFIKGVRPIDGVGTGERSLEVLQIEESANFRSNLGLFELTGNPATVEITGHVAGETASITVDLSGGEFRQLNSVFRQLGWPSVYSGRIRVRVVSGTGRVSSYASVIDSRTEDPTYVPAL